MNYNVSKYKKGILLVKNLFEDISNISNQSTPLKKLITFGKITMLSAIEENTSFTITGLLRANFGRISFKAIKEYIIKYQKHKKISTSSNEFPTKLIDDTFPNMLCHHFCRILPCPILTTLLHCPTVITYI